MTDKKFYKTIIQVEVLSEEPFDYNDLSDVHYQITEGDCSGTFKTLSSDELDGKQAADALKAQDSDPEFFQIDEDGNDL